MRLFNVEIYAERWDLDKSLWDVTSWMFTYDLIEDGTRVLWLGPFHFALHIYTTT